MTMIENVPGSTVRNVPDSAVASALPHSEFQTWGSTYIVMIDQCSFSSTCTQVPSAAPSLDLQARHVRNRTQSIRQPHKQILTPSFDRWGGGGEGEEEDVVRREEPMDLAICLRSV